MFSGVLLSMSRTPVLSDTASPVLTLLFESPIDPAQNEYIDKALSS
jgi:hypothetical protein